jgi:hypothetical protein
MDINHLGLYIGIAAFFFAIPLAIIANILTPMATNRWNNSTRARRVRALVALEEKINYAETTWIFTPKEWELTRIHLESLIEQSFLSMVTSYMVGLLSLTALQVAEDYIFRQRPLVPSHFSPWIIPVFPSHPALSVVLPWLIATLTFIFVSFICLLQYLKLRKSYRELKELHTERGIADLKAKHFALNI